MIKFIIGFGVCLAIMFLSIAIAYIYDLVSEKTNELTAFILFILGLCIASGVIFSVG